MKERVSNSKSYHEGRRRLLKALVTAGIVMGIPGSSGPQEEEPDQEIDKVLRRIAPHAKLVVVDDGYYWASPIQLVRLDYKSPKVAELIEKSRHLVASVNGVDDGVSRLTSQVIKVGKENERERVGYQTLSEEIQEGGVCVEKSALLCVLIEMLIPEAQPRIVDMMVETDVRKTSLLDFLRDFHNVVGFHGDREDVLFADPTVSDCSYSFSALNRLHVGILINRIVRLDLK